MKNRVTIAVVCLRISAGIYLLLGLFFLWLPFAPESGDRLPTAFGVIAFVLCAALACGIEAVVAVLRRHRFWAWVAGLCVFGLYLPSLFFPLGALGLWGLLAPGSRAAFRIGVQDAVDRGRDRTDAV